MLLFVVSLGFCALFVQNADGKTTFTDCGGPQKKISVLSGSVKPDPILYPGNVQISARMKILEDLPSSGLQMSLNLLKLDPMKMPVPCLKNIGSCTYDVCQLIENHKDQFCPMFPPDVKCGCPMKIGSYNMKNAFYAIPNFGDFFAKILQGHYNGTITFQDKNAKTEVGCIAVTFEIKSSL